MPLLRLFRTALPAAALVFVISGAALAQQPTRPREGVARPPQAAQAGQANRSTAGSSQQSAGGRAAGSSQEPASRAGAAAPGAVSPAPKPAAPGAGPAGSAAALVYSSGDWGVYTAQAGRSKVCYALSQPKDRQPKTGARDAAYLFVSFRPAENVRNEVAVVMGFATRENGAADATIGPAKYALITKGQNAWLKNPAEEGQAITSMARAQTIVVKAQSSKGSQFTDQYSLAGFGQAVERARRECS